MDPRTRIDHALFQLTPTRTRCDLVVVAGGVSESVASGLLEPFIAHLKTAKDQISKGGYSIILRPSGAYAPWFTKTTLQRFVRFVSSPEVLERLVTIEREIVQIENSIQSSENSSLGAESEDWNSKRSNTISKPKDELSGTSQVENEENSRVSLQRVLDNRKAMLRKEQAMAYARALVAGFDLDSIDDLICFADTFGASRLREACHNFLELIKQKNEDRLWIDEIAAMQAQSHPELPYLRTSGIVLAGEDTDAGGKQNGFVDASVYESTPSHASLDINQDNGLPTDGRAQRPMPWPNHLPQYHHFQGPVFQQMPPYQGYIYPGMQVPPSYFPGNMHWPPNMEDSRVAMDQDLDDRRSRKGSIKKKKHSQVQGNSEEDESSTSDHSSNESDSEEPRKSGKKKQGKKSSRKVVIRNINYITSNGDGEKGSMSEESLSGDEEHVNGDSLKHQVEEALDSLERRHKSTSRHHKKRDKTKLPGRQKDSAAGKETKAVTKDNDNWGAFQSLLLREEEPTSGAERRTDHFEEYSGNKNMEHERSSASNLKSDKVIRAVSNDSFIVMGGKFDSGDQTRIEYYKEGNDGSTIVRKINSTDEEFMLSKRNDESGNYSSSAVLPSSGTESSVAKRHKEEDWFIVSQSGKPANEYGNKDFSIFNGDSIPSSAAGGSHSDKTNKGVLADDSFMIQSCSSENQFSSLSAVQISLDSDIVSTEFANSRQESLPNGNEKVNAQEPSDLFMMLDRETTVEQSVAPWTFEIDFENIPSKEQSSKPLDVETDEKQLSSTKGTGTKTYGVRTGKVSGKETKSKALNGSLGKSRSDITSRSKASPGSRTTGMKSKYDKEEENRKRMEELTIQRQNRIAERSSKTRAANKTSLTSVKNEKPKIDPSTEQTKKLHKPVLRNSTIERLATARVSQKASTTQAKSVTAEKPPSKANALLPKKTASEEKEKVSTLLPKKTASEEKKKVSTLLPKQTASEEKKNVSTLLPRKTASAEKKKPSPKEVKSSKQKDDKKKLNGALPSDTNAQIPHNMEGEVVLPLNHNKTQSVEPNDFNVGLKDIEEVPRMSTEKNAGHSISEPDSILENVGQYDTNSVPNQGHTSGRNLSKGEVLDKVSSALREDKPEDTTHVAIIPEAASPNNALTPPISAMNSKVYHESHENSPASPKKSGIEISTPPPSVGLMPESVHSRKKWNSGEDSSKAAKGFRKLLFFGRRS